eukprot:TRINITY_DN38686_c0_g1_i2.p1 TRINITY_DN38686_c0_g1~~TRINITY_DN38686_c0_g1_i2.p1  ORF type:complete len:120 (+),score=30.35 TRINITY_DN38686_c0_g1_i2:42-401(+)
MAASAASSSGAGGPGQAGAGEADEFIEAERLLSELASEVDDQQKRQQLKRRKTRDESLQSAAANALMAADPGTDTTERLPLRLLTGQRCVAWRWLAEDGTFQHMIGIGCSRPFSPFSDD